MARRARKWVPTGRWLKTARKDAGLTLQELAASTGISTSSLNRFERDEAVSGFGDVCVIARQLGWPLLYFATGMLRTRDDDRSLIAHLQFWGLRDVRTPEPVLLGEARAFEELFAKVLSRPINQRVLAALPALLLRNAFDAHRLISAAEGYGSLRRVGWLADVASYVSARLPVGAIQPDAQGGLSDVARTAASALQESPFHRGEFRLSGYGPIRLQGGETANLGREPAPEAPMADRL